jgi:hypothetical protein
VGASARQHAANVEIFVHRQRWKNLPSFRDLAETEIADAVTWPTQDIFTAKYDAARGRPVHASERADERGLTGAVGADNGDDRAFLNVERYAIKRLHVAIKHIERFDVQHQTASAPR